MPLSNLKQIQSKEAGSIMTSETFGNLDVSSEENRHLMIAQAAYFRAMARGFEGGHEEEDWYAAEAEIDQVLSH